VAKLVPLHLHGLGVVLLWCCVVVCERARVCAVVVAV
jgi:hypothetical protein